MFYSYVLFIDLVMLCFSYVLVMLCFSYVLFMLCFSYVLFMFYLYLF